jgi:hypothetical protein
VKASSVASNSDVPAACLIHRIYDAALSNSEDLLIELEKAYLKGQSQKVVFAEAVQYAISTRRVCAIENLFKVDIGRVRQLTAKDVDVNALRPQVIDRAIQGKKTDVDILKLFLDLGLNIRKVFGGFGDALMFAVRIGRWELIERILMQRGSFNVDKVKVGQQQYPILEDVLLLHEFLLAKTFKHSTTSTATHTLSSPLLVTAFASAISSATTALLTQKKPPSGQSRSASSSHSSTGAPTSKAPAFCPTWQLTRNEKGRRSALPAC